MGSYSSPPALSDGTYNVKRYGARGNARKVTDAVLVNGSPTVTSATAAFTQADVGKIIYAIQSATGLVRLPLGTILTVGSATSITASTNATANLSGITLVLGTDDADAIRAAVTAAKAGAQPGKVIIPAGGYIFSKCLFDIVNAGGQDSISIIGAGSGSTFFYLAPNYDLATTQANAGLFNRLLNASRVRMFGFTVDGVSWLSGFSTSYYGISIQSTSMVLEDVIVVNFNSIGGGIAVWSANALLVKCRAETIINGDGMRFEACSVVAIDCYAGNSGLYSLFVNNIANASNLGNQVRWFGGIVDESTSGGLNATVATGVQFIGATLLGPSTKFAATVDGTSVVRFIGGEVVPWTAANNRSGLKVLAGGKAYLSGGVRVGYSGTGVSLNNAGTIYDYGSVIDLGSVTGAAPVTLVSYQGVEVSPAQITADQNNYDPGSLAEVLRLTTDASRAITGLKPAALTPSAGQTVQIINAGANALVLTHESASSVAANRLHSTTGADLTLSADQEALCRYDSTTARWRCSKRS